MGYAGKDYIINTVFRTNTLPVISECNTACSFCSNKYNPEGVETYSMPKTSLKEFEEIIEFLSPDKKIVVGEAATRIMEGEPLLYKHFIELVNLIRKRYRNTPIQITTNGILLNEEIIDKLAGLGNIQLYISVNCINPLKRKQILGLKTGDGIREKIEMLSGKVKFSASCVYDPDFLDPADLDEMVAFLEKNRAESIRVFLPGYTKKKANTPNFYDIQRDIKEFIHSMRMAYEIPIILEPPVLGDLSCTIEGIVKDSPAYHSGLRYRDIILEVNHQEVKSRVDGFRKAYDSCNPILKVKREEEELVFAVAKPKNASPGFVVSYDVHPDLVKNMSITVHNHKASKVLILTSELAFHVIRQLLDTHQIHFSYDVIKAGNTFFGGTIKCAGLLTVDDMNEAVAHYLASNRLPELILLPPVMFDFKGKDLLGRRLKEIEERFKIPVDTISFI